MGERAPAEGRDFMDAPFARTVVLAVMWNWVCTVYGRGTFAHVTFTLISIFAVGIPLALFGFVYDCCKRRKGPRSKRFLGVLWRVVFLIFIQVIHLECGQYLLEKDVANAQSYCESYVTALEEYKTEKGIYPPHLSALPFYEEQRKAESTKKIEVPWMLKERKTQEGDERNSPFYEVASDGKSFRFYFEDPSAIGGMHYVYNSTASGWAVVNATSASSA